MFEENRFNSDQATWAQRPARKPRSLTREKSLIRELPLKLGFRGRGRRRSPNPPAHCSRNHRDPGLKPPCSGERRVCDLPQPRRSGAVALLLRRDPYDPWLPERPAADTARQAGAARTDDADGHRLLGHPDRLRGGALWPGRPRPGARTHRRSLRPGRGPRRPGRPQIPEGLRIPGPRGLQRPRRIHRHRPCSTRFGEITRNRCEAWPCRWGPAAIGSPGAVSPTRCSPARRRRRPRSAPSCSTTWRRRRRRGRPSATPWRA